MTARHRIPTTPSAPAGHRLPMLGSRELWLAGLAIALVSLVYAGVSGLGGVPAASGLIGHSLGILGFALMLATETLYSLRKRAIRRPWGRMSEWLRFHIFTGIVGPYLVLLHSAWEFHGLAGLVMLLTVIVVLSGFTGRYIYTAVPRTADGIVMEAEALQAEIATIDLQLAAGQRNPSSPESESEAIDADSSGRRPNRSPASWILARAILDLRDRWTARRTARGLNPETRQRIEQRSAAMRRRRQLERQIASLATARRMLAVWHTVHIPLGMALFVAAFAHAAGALYYATLLR